MPPKSSRKRASPARAVAGAVKAGALKAGAATKAVARARFAPVRRAEIERRTKETHIAVAVDLDGTGAYSVRSGIGFLDHMLEQLSRHSLIDLTLAAKGDLHIDFHHTTEDTGIVIGEAVSRALGDRAGI